MKFPTVISAFPRITAVVKERSWADLDVMHTGQARGWVRRAFNIALRSAKLNEQVGAYLHLQMIREPYTPVSGSISGVNGRHLVDRGCFEDN